ncbi:DUF938 domain-containing protein [Sulfitobacter aestuariivivens]|uniref:DUF938 domain-containing protein n=1 Tax=Sulfitobacter aestuariivivens TaxID=2766981 RepID=A0A927D2Z0_9RHOB|nr:DUF938 domain-containing protein [Sulfitobacter aestuariivivens]MBD3664070.1 DUF938 domain-containing protein [Sulfitobacter aestuariivivens]
MAQGLPPSASVVRAQEGQKLHAPAAARNAAALTDLLRKIAPTRGRALEIASGTGQHITAFANALRDIEWQPTDVDPARLYSIDAYRKEAVLDNILPAQHLDATVPGWYTDHARKDLIVLINLLHLISVSDARTVVSEAAKALAKGGVLFLYGPFKRDGVLTSAGDQRFDAELRGADPAIGYKDDLDIVAWLGDAGMATIESVEMPANNLALIARKE